MKLLFIEDETPFFRWLSESLDGHECHQAKTVEEAEDMMSDHNYDAVFIDLCIPGSSVRENIARARTAARCPLVVLTGMEMRTDVAGICDGFLYKGGLNPERDIPSAVNYYRAKAQAEHPMDRTVKLFNALKGLTAA